MSNESDARQQAIYKLEGIKEMMARLSHIEECKPYLLTLHVTKAECSMQFDTLDEYREYHDHDAALEAITESPLSVEVRSGWHTPNSDGVNLIEPVEYQILLCTGGPAVRLVGELGNDSEPISARLECQDWGTPWTELHGFDTTEEYSEAQAFLLSYAGQFWFGE